MTIVIGLMINRLLSKAYDALNIFPVPRGVTHSDKSELQEEA